MKADTITIVRAPGRFLAKRIGADGTVRPAEKAFRVDLTEVSIYDLTALRDLLRALAGEWWSAVVRGGIVDPARTRGVRRLIHPDGIDMPTLCERPRLWLANDVDSLPCRAEMNRRDLEACARIAVAALPAEFHGVRCIIQATGSHGIKPGIRVRLWHWLDRPVSGAELKRWFRRSPVDHAVFSACQLIFTAAPIFLDRSDHLPARMAEVPGEPVVRAPPVAALAPPPPRRPQPLPYFATSAEAQSYAQAALVRAAQCIMGAVEGERHRTLIRTCCGLTPLLRAGALAEPIAREVVRRATEAAGWSDPDKIESAISWAFARPSEDPFPEIGDA